MSAPTQKKTKISGGPPAATEQEAFLLYKGGEVGWELRSKLTHVRVDARVTRIPVGTFSRCQRLIKVQLNEGLQTIEKSAFELCKALRSVVIPSTVTQLGSKAFWGCRSLVEVCLNEGLQVIGDEAFARCTALQNIILPSTVIELSSYAFFECKHMVEVQIKEGLQVIGTEAFGCCEALRSINLPSTVTRFNGSAFIRCSNLVELQLNEGLQIIGISSFQACTALRSLTVPSTVSKLSNWTFYGCANLSEVILLGGQRLLNQEFLARRLSDEERILNHEMIRTLIGESAFRNCPLTIVKISISWAVSARMARLTPECRVSVEERINDLPHLELIPGGNAVACFPLVSGESDDQADDDSDTEDGDISCIQDTNNETARSLYRALQLIAYQELRESSILLELAMWKSRIDGTTTVPRADCRVAIPGPVKSLIMEYCGFVGFLRPAFEGT